MTSLLRARAPSRFNFYKTKNIMALEIEGRIKQKLAKQRGQRAKGLGQSKILSLNTKTATIRRTCV